MVFQKETKCVLSDKNETELERGLILPALSFEGIQRS